jgi:hypothetical protein
MANIVITSSTNLFKVEFNDMASAAQRDKGCWQKSDVRFDLAESASSVIVTVKGEPQWVVQYSGGMQIDSVNGVAPTSNSDLYDKLITLLG